MIRPERRGLFHALYLRHGVHGARLTELQADLEPIFRVADEPPWPDGTDCGPLPSKRGRGHATKLLPHDEAHDLAFQPMVRDLTDPEEAVRVGDRYHDLVCGVVGYAILVDIGSLLGNTLLDALHSRIGAIQPKAYVLLQILALYRTAAAVGGLETEASLLGIRIRRHFKDEERIMAMYQVEPHEAVSMG